ncbi:MAG: 5'-methylthioadenosine/adenosylhomocysteine nucleosidase [Prevotella sp.]|nr:5'-methylthioadenosine/adenosylhomocysteine nucleosidase [Prevotella sp.]
MKIGIIIAMDKEFRRISELLDGLKVEIDGGRKFVTGRLGDNELVLHQCGIGKVNAAIGASEMIRRYNPDLMVSTGCAGGGRTDMEVMDIVASTELAYHDVYCGEAMGKTVYGQVQGMPARYTSPSELVEKAKAVSPRVHAGLIVTGDWFVDSKEKMREIVGHFPEAAAVDMESAAIAQTCHIYGIPFISFRVISDIPLNDTNAAMYHDFWNTIADNSFETTREFLLRINN